MSGPVLVLPPHPGRVGSQKGWAWLSHSYDERDLGTALGHVQESDTACAWVLLKPSSVVICYSRPTPPPARTLRPRPQPGAPGFLLGHIRNAVWPGAREEVGFWSRAHRHPAALTWGGPSNWGGKPVPRATLGGRQRPRYQPIPKGILGGR